MDPFLPKVTCGLFFFFLTAIEANSDKPEGIRYPERRELHSLSRSFPRVCPKPQNRRMLRGSPQQIIYRLWRLSLAGMNPRWK